MKINLIVITVATLALTGLGFYIIGGYGNAKYQSGYDKAHNECKQSQLEGSDKARTILEKEMRDANKVQTVDIDNILHGLGILRDDKDL